MDHRDAVSKRRMVRHYTPEPVDPEAAGRIARAALAGPSAGNSQGISVVVVTREDRRLAIARLAGEPDRVARGFDPWLSSAPVHIVLCIEPDRYRSRYAEPDKDRSALDIPWWWVDGGAALGLVLLAAVNEGLAAGFLGAHAVPGLSEHLGLPSNVEPIGVVTVGHPAADRRSSSLERGRRPEDETLRWENW